jgi:hypothetical protein
MELNPIDELLPVIAQAVATWKLKNTPDKIKSKVTDLLDANSKEITMKLLGFSNNWNRGWELDHYNGRSSDSAAGDFIRSTQAEAIKEWLAQVSMPSLDTKTKNKLIKQAQATYEDYLGKAVRAAIERKATADADLVIAHLSQSQQIDKHLQVLKLINLSGE